MEHNTQHHIATQYNTIQRNTNRQPTAQPTHYNTTLQVLYGGGLGLKLGAFHPHHAVTEDPNASSPTTGETFLKYFHAEKWKPDWPPAFP